MTIHMINWTWVLAAYALPLTVAIWAAYRTAVTVFEWYTRREL